MIILFWIENNLYYNLSHQCLLKKLRKRSKRVERLQKVMARAGVASRRCCEEFIKQGKVQVNGQIVRELGMKVDPQQDQIRVEGRLLQIETTCTFLFYKPLRVITSMSDPRRRKVVADYFRHVKERVYPVGRLDYDTEGLLLMTNDGDLAHRLMHPRYEIEKQYLATLKGVITPQALCQLQEGVRLEEGWTAPAKVRLLSKDDKTSSISLTIHEGRNRQIRRMCESVGFPVIALKRERIGFLTLQGLQPGQYRKLTESELARLQKMLRS
jgi:23S rRNA pseudouridine2605 synthase